MGCHPEAIIKYNLDHDPQVAANMQEDTLNICLFLDGRATGAGKDISFVLFGFKIMEQLDLPEGISSVHALALYHGNVLLFCVALSAGSEDAEEMQRCLGDDFQRVETLSRDGLEWNGRRVKIRVRVSVDKKCFILVCIISIVNSKTRSLEPAAATQNCGFVASVIG